MPAADLLQAIVRALHGSPALAAGFGPGRSEFAWLDQGAGDALPVAVLTEGPRSTLARPLSDRGVRVSHDAGTLILTVYALSRLQARTLARAAARTIEAAALAGTLANEECHVVDVERTGSEGGEIDPDPDPQGRDVWMYRVELAYLITEADP